MYVKLAPPEYISFEDPYVADLCAYFWGDTEILNSGVLTTGTLIGNNNNVVSSVPIFANNCIINAHKTSRNTTFPYTDSRTVSYRLYLEINGNLGTNIWDITNVTDETAKIVNIKCLKRGSTSWTSLASVVQTSWADEKTQHTVVQYDSTNNKYYIDFSTPANCRYIQIDVCADSNIAISWHLDIISGTVYKPIGITTKQCSLVDDTTFEGNTSQFGRFSHNQFITKFNEFRYFTNITDISGSYNGGRTAGFSNCSNLLEITLPDSVISLGDICFYNCSSLYELDFKNVITLGRGTIGSTCNISSIVLKEGFTTASSNNNGTKSFIDFPSTTTNVGSNTMSVSTAIVVIRATTPPTNNGWTYCKRLYVPQDSVDTYKNTSPWSSIAAKIYPIEGSYYETHRELDPNEPA